MVTCPTKCGELNYVLSSRLKRTIEPLAAKKVRDAAAEGSFEDVCRLVSRGANVKKADLKGRTPLHFAACRGNSNIVQLLIDFGASVNERDCNGSTPLHLACCTNHIEVITTLLRAGTVVDAVDDKGITPLRLAHSRLRITRDGDDDAELPFTRKTEVLRIVEMLKEFLMATHGSKDETTELEELASKLSISDTLKQVDEVHSLLEGFTSLSIQRRELQREHANTSS